MITGGKEAYAGHGDNPLVYKFASFATIQFLSTGSHNLSKLLILWTSSRPTRYEDNGLNRLITVIDPAEGSTQYTYDNRNNLIRLTDANGSQG